MRQSRAFIPTMREIPTDVEIKSHQLLLRAGFLRQHASGVYSYLPFGLKVLKKIEAIVHEEMAAIAAVEIKSATLQKENLAQLFGLTEEEKAHLLQVKDHRNRAYTVGKLHKEQMISLIKEEIHSYKQLPLTLYQTMMSFQDVARPRYGLIESRELLKKEAYSFHNTKEGLREKYEEMKQAYRTIFSKLHLKQYELFHEVIVEREQYSEQFIAPFEHGNEEIAYSHTGNFAEKLELAPVTYKEDLSEEPFEGIEKVATPGLKTIRKTAQFLKKPMRQFLKTSIYRVEDDFIAVISRGDHVISEAKLKRALHSTTVTLAEEKDVETLLNCQLESVGPVHLPVDVRIIADQAVKFVVNGIAGANETGAHLLNVNAERDFAVNEYVDIRYIEEGELAPDETSEIHFTKGVEVGRLASLGTAYSLLAEANVTDESSERNPIHIGFYEMNMSRILALLAEQHHDEFGLKWPKDLAPCDIHLIPIDLNDEHQAKFTMDLYRLLQSYHFEVLLDDRSERAGVKFQDADLIGLPIRITVGQKAEAGILEVKFRDTGETAEWQIGEVTEKLQAYFTMIG